MEESIPLEQSVSSNIARDLMALLKARLSSLVVISAVLGYLLASGKAGLQWTELWALVIGGFLVTGGSNGLNQVIERKSDLLMERTKNRPVAQGRLSPTLAIVFSIGVSLIGLAALYFYTNLNAAILALSALLSYAFIYTPMKKKTPWAVFVGAFPGAIPPMLGWIACTGEFGLVPGALFAIQFIWQFPHFWSIAWLLDDDYAKAGIRLLPYNEGRSSRSAFLVFMYSLWLIPVGLLPWTLGVTGVISAAVGVFLSSFFAFMAYLFYKEQDMRSARQLMFTTFFYLPLLQIVFVLDRI